jgi:proteic killer suppression protein
MIANFASQMAEDIFNGTNSRYARNLPISLHAKARRLLDQLNAVTVIETLRVPPSNKLAKLSGDLKDFWRIKIDKQWAIIFMWDNGTAFNVDIIDYH